MASEDDDFQKLSELLFGAKERYRSVRAEITHTVVGAVAEESNRRFVDWRFAQPGGSGMGGVWTDDEGRIHSKEREADTQRPHAFSPWANRDRSLWR